MPWRPWRTGLMGWIEWDARRREGQRENTSSLVEAMPDLPHRFFFYYFMDVRELNVTVTVQCVIFPLIYVFYIGKILIF